MRKWKSHTDFSDASHTAHRLQITLTQVQKRIFVELRKSLLRPLNDLLAVTHEFLCPDISGSRPQTSSFAACREQPFATQK